MTEPKPDFGKFGSVKAFILAAGLGTRLAPLTNDRPKALVEVGGTPLLGFALYQLKRSGFTEVVVNVHHFADQIETYLRDHAPAGMSVEVSDERDQLLGTGGAIRKAAPLLGSDTPFLIYNADIITDLDLNALFRFHQKSGALATLAVRQRSSSRQLHFDHLWNLKAWSNAGSGKEKGPIPPQCLPLARAFSGIHILDPKIFSFLPAEDFFSITDVYLDLCAESAILGYDHTETHWIDAGKIADLPAASELAKKIMGTS